MISTLVITLMDGQDCWALDAIKTMQIDPSLQILKNYTWLHILKLLIHTVYLKHEHEALIIQYYKLGNQQ
jgi:hypothetical protein